MRRFLNLRFFLLSLVVVGLAGGGVYAAAWYMNRPDYLLRSAQGYYAKADQALQAGDEHAARQHLQYGEKQLQRLLEKVPQQPQALVLRGKLLGRLSALVQKEEEAAGSAEGQRLAADMARNSLFYLSQAATNPHNVEAQALMLDYCFRTNDWDRAVPYAKNLLKHYAGEPIDLPSFSGYLVGARFALARAALAANVPAADEALEHLRRSEELQREEWNNAKTGDAPPPPRWRAVGLEALALKAKAKNELTKKKSAADQGPNSREALQKKFPAWLERARREMDQRGSDDRPVFADLSVTDTHGLLDTLAIAVEFARGKEELAGRVDLLLAVSEKMTSVPDPRPHVPGEAIQHVAQVPGLVNAHPADQRPAKEAWAELAERMDKLVARSLAATKAVDPRTYVELARAARQAGRMDEAAKFAHKGLDAAKALRLPAEHPAALELHAETAWILLLQRKHLLAEEHLALLRGSRALAGSAHFMAGLLAVQDGRLDLAVRELTLAQQHAAFRDNLHLSLGLANAYMGLGKFDRALPHLMEAQARYQNLDQLSADDRALALQLLPDQAALDLETVSCYVGLDQLDQALEYKKRLQYKAEELPAQVLVINAFITRGRKLQLSDPAAAQQAFEAAAAELTTARRVYPDDPKLVLAEASLTAGQIQYHPGLVLTNTAALLGGPLTRYARVAEAGWLGLGLSWNLVRADHVVYKFALDEKKKDLERRLAWVRWLRLRGRYQEANDFLVRLADADFPEHKRSLQLLRAHLLLRQGQLAEAGRLALTVEPIPGDLQGDLWSLLYLSTVERNPDEARKKLAQALSQHESNGLLHYCQGQLAQSEGNFREAVLSYERSLEFTQLRATARAGLLVSLLGMALNESPVAAHEQAARLRKAHPDDPALLLAYAETAVLVDKITGPDGMEAALNRLALWLRDERREPALGFYFLARGWLAAGRTDLARGEVEKALQATPGHAPSLLLAGEIALAAKDWPALLEYAKLLAEAQPKAPEPLLWRAVALDRQGRPAEARTIYQELLQQHPEHALGYLGLARLLEHTGDTGTALNILDQCRLRCPEETEALRLQVRLLVRCGRTAEAVALGERVVRDQLERLQDRQAALPPVGEKEKARRAVLDQDARADREVSLWLKLAAGFSDAKAYRESETCFQRARAAAEKRSEPVRRELLCQIERLLGDVYVLQSMEEKTAERRKEFLNKALMAYGTANQHSPGNLHAANNLAWLLHEERRDAQAAYAVLQRARQARPSQRPLSGDRLGLDVLDTLGVVYRAAGHDDEAAVVLEEAASRYPGEPSIFLHLGRAYAALRDYSRAFENLTKAVRFASARAAAAADPQDKARWQKLAADAGADQQRLRKSGS